MRYNINILVQKWGEKGILSGNRGNQQLFLKAMLANFAMRLLIKLQALTDFTYDPMYYHKAQGFVYNQLLGTTFEPLHDAKGCKFFCFSNIFPFSSIIKTNDSKNWLISSPDREFIGLIKEKLEKKQNENEQLHIGEMQFTIQEIKPIKNKFKENSWIDTATPIVIRIPAYNYAKYGLTQLQYSNGTFWRPEHSFEAFVKQVTENAYKKFEQYFGEKLEQEPLIEAFKFIKSTSNKVIIDGKEQIIIGSVWNLKPSNFTRNQKRVLNFAIDTGLGEKNSQGFGFVNVV